MKFWKLLRWISAGLFIALLLLLWLVADPHPNTRGATSPTAPIPAPNFHH